MKESKNIKCMLLGIAIFVLAIWCLLCGSLDDVPLLLGVGVVLPLPGIVCVIFGFISSDEGTKES